MIAYLHINFAYKTQEVKMLYE